MLILWNLSLGRISAYTVLGGPGSKSCSPKKLDK